MRRAILMAFALALVAGDAAASPEDIFGYGGRTSAMGATGVAYASGYESAWHNPALASQARKNELTIGWLGAVFRLDAKGAPPAGASTDQPAKGTLIGAEIPIPLRGRLANRIGLALAFYEPTDVVVRGRILYPEKTQFPILPERAQSVTIRAGVGVDVGYGIRVGAGVAALAEIAGTVVAATDATGRVGTRVEDQLVATYSPVFGVTYDLPIHGHGEIWRAGIAYRGTLDARFAVVIDASKISSLQIPLFNIAGVAQYDPAQIAAEIARVDKLQVFALQFTYKRWSSFPGIVEPTVVCSEGGPGACGLTPPTIDWRDTFAIRAGAEQGFELSKDVVIKARGGAFFETSPLPDTLPSSQAYDLASKGTINVPTAYFDADRLAFTIGTGIAFRSIDLDLFGQYQLLLTRTIKSTDPNGATLLQGDASGHIAAFGMTAGVKF